MFKFLDKQSVQSDKGFIVQFTGRFELEYLEGGRKITIYREPLALNGKYYSIISKDAFVKWDSSEESITREKQEELLNNFRDAMAMMDFCVIVAGVDMSPAEVGQAQLSAMLKPLAENPNVTSIMMTEAETGKTKEILVRKDPPPVLPRPLSSSQDSPETTP